MLKSPNRQSIRLKTNQSNNFENSLEGDQVIKALQGETPTVTDYFKNILSPDDIHLAFEPNKTPEPKRWDPVEPGNYGWFGSDRRPKSKPDPKSGKVELPWNRSKSTDRILFEALTNQILYDIVEASFQKMPLQASVR